MIRIQSLVRQNIIDQSPYSSARKTLNLNNIISLDANENPYGQLRKYPDTTYRKLIDSLSNYHSISTKNLCVGNGSDEIIDLLIRVFCEPKKDRIATFEPTYGMYEVSANISNVETVKFQLNKDFQIDPNDIHTINATNDLKLIFICSPNNPTGNTISKQQISNLINTFNGIIVIDEAYIDFSSNPSLIPFTESNNNVVILRTMSKSFGLAGARIGYAIADKLIIDYVNKIKPPYSISTLNQKAAINALNNIEAFKLNLLKILKEKKWMLNQLKEVEAIDELFISDTNFILIKAQDPKGLYRYLISKKIYVRDRRKQVSDSLRITIGTRTENRLFIKTIREYYG